MLGLNNYVIVVVVNALSVDKKPTDFFDKATTTMNAALNSIQASIGNPHAKSNIQKQAYPLGLVKTIREAYGITSTNFSTHTPYINGKRMDINSIIRGPAEILLIKNNLNPKEAIIAASGHRALPMRSNSVIPRKLGEVLPPIKRTITHRYEILGTGEAPGPIFGAGNAGQLGGYDDFGGIGVVQPPAAEMNGVTGPTGAAGAQGAIGPVGPQGRRGAVPVAPAGAVGATGADGGSTGPTGAIGPAGAAGAAGMDGAAGIDGADGATGVTGMTGVTGATGADGTGSTTFLGFTDTPGSYAGQSNKVVVVNPGETALEFSNSAVNGAAITRAILSEQTFNSGSAFATVKWMEPIYNDDSMTVTEFPLGTSTTLVEDFTVVTTAVYQITGHIMFEYHAPGWRAVQVIINRASNPSVIRVKGHSRMRSIGALGSPMRPSIPFSTTLSLFAGDIVNVQVAHDAAAVTIGKLSVGDDPAEPGAISIVRMP